MPFFPTGELTKEEAEKVNKWLLDKGVLQTCPACSAGHEQLILAPHVVSHGVYVLPVAHGPVVTSYPFVMVVCQRCGYTRFFNSVLIGLKED